jgi:hypothetical protein
MGDGNRGRRINRRGREGGREGREFQSSHGSSNDKKIFA